MTTTKQFIERLEFQTRFSSPPHRFLQRVHTVPEDVDIPSDWDISWIDVMIRRGYRNLDNLYMIPGCVTVLGTIGTVTPNQVPEQHLLYGRDIQICVEDICILELQNLMLCSWSPEEAAFMCRSANFTALDMLRPPWSVQ